MTQEQTPLSPEDQQALARFFESEPRPQIPPAVRRSVADAIAAEARNRGGEQEPRVVRVPRTWQRSYYVTAAASVAAVALVGLAVPLASDNRTGTGTTTAGGSAVECPELVPAASGHRYTEATMWQDTEHMRDGEGCAGHVAEPDDVVSSELSAPVAEAGPAAVRAVTGSGSAVAMPECVARLSLGSRISGVDIGSYSGHAAVVITAHRPEQVLVLDCDSNPPVVMAQRLERSIE